MKSRIVRLLQLSLVILVLGSIVNTSITINEGKIALSIAGPVGYNDTDTFTLVGRVGSASTTGYMYMLAVLNLIL